MGSRPSHAAPSAGLRLTVRCMDGHQMTLELPPKRRLKDLLDLVSAELEHFPIRRSVKELRSFWKWP